MSLDFISVTKPGAPRLTVYGERGVGKTTFASSFPSPLFILFEDAELPGIHATPIINSMGQFREIVGALLAAEDLPYKTLVIDSISKLDHLIIKETIETSPTSKGGRKPETLAESWGGYGAGYEKAADKHRAFKSAMDRFKERDITVIYIGHEEVKKYKSPEHEDYDVITLALHHDKSRAAYTDDVDAVLHCKKKTYTVETNSGRTLIKTLGDRVVSCGLSGAYVSKNRYGIGEELPLEFEAFRKWIPFYGVEDEGVESSS